MMDCGVDTYRMQVEEQGHKVAMKDEVKLVSLVEIKVRLFVITVARHVTSQEIVRI